MKHNLNRLLPTILAGFLGFFLQSWYLSAAVDEKGLPVSFHPVGFLVLVFSIFVVGLLAWSCRGLGKERKGQTSSLGLVFAAAGILLTALRVLKDPAGSVDRITGTLGLLASLSALALAWFRGRGERPSVAFSVWIPLFFVFYLLGRYQVWSAQSQFLTYAFPFLASVCLMLASYHRAAFDADLGDYTRDTFYHLAALYFCLASLAGGRDVVFFGAMALWMALEGLQVPEKAAA